MLWYKTWLETRSRFLLSLLNIVALCSFNVYHGNEGAMPYTKIEYYYIVLHGGHTMLCMLWVLAVTLLAMGGLLREKAVGTAPFTLALPVSRARLVAVRISMVLGQAMVLVIVPWIAMFLIGTWNGKTHSLQQAFFHMVLLAGGGVALLVRSDEPGSARRGGQPSRRADRSGETVGISAERPAPGRTPGCRRWAGAAGTSRSGHPQPAGRGGL